MEHGRFCFVPFSPRGLELLQGLCSLQGGGGSFLLPAVGGLALQNDPGWVQSFTSDAVGGDVTDKLNLKGKSFYDSKGKSLQEQNLFLHLGSVHQRIFLKELSVVVLHALQGGVQPCSCVPEWGINYLI